MCLNICACALEFFSALVKFGFFFLTGQHDVPIKVKFVIEEYTSCKNPCKWVLCCDCYIVCSVCFDRVCLNHQQCSLCSYFTKSYILWTVAFIMWNCAKSQYLLLLIVQVSRQHCVVLILVCFTVSWLLQVCDMWQVNSNYNRWVTHLSSWLILVVDFSLQYYYYCVLSASILASPAWQKDCGFIWYMWKHGDSNNRRLVDYYFTNSWHQDSSLTTGSHDSSLKVITVTGSQFALSCT